MPALKLLLIGGSGFVSGTLARHALEAGHEVWVVTRGQRPLAPGLRGITADRKDHNALRAAIGAVGVKFDMAVDCIGYEPQDVQAALEALAGRARHFTFISTDFVYDPAHRLNPQPEETTHYVTEPNYGGKKRLCELQLIEQPAGAALPWTIFRPCHIYGPGSLLGCSPPDNRDNALIQKIREGRPVRLVGPHFMQQPIFAPDLARLILSVPGNAAAVNQVFNSAGPDRIRSDHYYRLIGQALGLPVTFDELDLAAYQAAHPDKAPFLCHRVYDLTRLKSAGLAVPATPAPLAIRQHVASLIGA